MKIINMIFGGLLYTSALGVGKEQKSQFYRLAKLDYPLSVLEIFLIVARSPTIRNQVLHRFTKCLL